MKRRRIFVEMPNNLVPSPRPLLILLDEAFDYVAECVLRPAFLDLSGPLEGFAVTFYLTALGPDPDIARRRWELAMDDLIALLRSKELEAARGSATIDSTDAYPLRVRHLGS